MSARRVDLAPAAAAVLSVAAYAFPVLVGLAADLSHGTHHLAERLQDHRRSAAAVGVVYDHDVKGPYGSGVARYGPFVHSHGGSTHSHDTATDALLEVAERTDDQSDDDRAPASKLVGHLPARATSLELDARSGGVVVAQPTVALSTSTGPPPLPPPRA